ncbi:MAG: PfkB family carbohydrate kinase [Deltaproteobacteria bacterium]
MSKTYDIAFLGHYTKDTIVSADGTRVVDGGAFNYGSHAAVRMGLRVAAITRLAREDFNVVDELKALGVDVFARATPRSTCLRLEYPTSNVDERILFITSSAEPFTVSEVKDISSKAFVIGASDRGEVPLDVIEELRKKKTLIAIDLQGFIWVVEKGRFVFQSWPEKGKILATVDVVKGDAVESALLTGQRDIRTAAKLIAGFGPKEVVLTHREGVLVYEGNHFYDATFHPGKLVGRSGRGDTCIASYMARRLNRPPSEAAVWAAAVTSLKMEAEGPFRRNIREVEDLIRRKYSGNIQSPPKECPA